MVRNIKDEDKLSDTKEIVNENNSINPNNSQGLSRDKTLKGIKHESKLKTENFAPESIIEEEEEEEGENKEDKSKEDNYENHEFRVNPSKKNFISNSKNYITLHENYIGKQQDRKINESKKYYDDENNFENTESNTEPYANLGEGTKDRNISKALYETEGMDQDCSFNDNINVKSYKIYNDERTNSLDVINESNNEYNQSENSINFTEEKLEKLNDTKDQNNITECRKSRKKISRVKSKSSISSIRKKKKSFVKSDEKLTQVDESISVSKTNGGSKQNKKSSSNISDSNYSESEYTKKGKKIGSSNSIADKIKNKNKTSKTNIKLKSSSVSNKYIHNRSKSRSRSHSRNLTRSTTYDSESQLNQEIELLNEENVVEKDFNNLKEQLINGIGEFESALNEFIEWKNEINNNNIPSNMKLEVTLLFSKLFRSKNMILTPLFETLRKVDIYSKKWVNKNKALSKIEEDYLSQDHLIKIAIKKMLQLNFQINQLKSDKSTENWNRLLEKIFKKYKLLKYKNYKYEVNDFSKISDNVFTEDDFNEYDKDYYEKKIEYLKNKLNTYKEKDHDNVESKEDGEIKKNSDKSKKKKNIKSRSNDDQNQISENLFLKILENEKRKLNKNNLLFNKTLQKRKPKLSWNRNRRIATNLVRYKYMIQKNFRVLPYLIQHLKEYITKGFWRGPYLLRNHYISEYNNDIYTRPYFKKYVSADIMPNHNSCTNLKELLKLSTNKVNPYLVRSNSYCCGQEFPWFNSCSINENSFKEEHETKNKQKLNDNNIKSKNLIHDPLNDLDNYIKEHITKEKSTLINSENLADLSNNQIRDIITILYPDTESIVKIYNEEQPKFYLGSDDEYDEIEEIENKIMQDEIKKATTSTKLLNAINDSYLGLDSNDIDNINWKNDILQEDIIYNQIKDEINSSDDYVPWRSEIEELYINPYNKNQYDRDVKSKFHEFLNTYNSNIVNGLRSDVKENIANKINGEQGNVDEGIIGNRLSADFENKIGELTEYFDPEKTWFSLQDVMELTLLHAQQMELLNDEYSKEVDNLNQRLVIAEELQKEPKKDKEERKNYIRKISELNEIIKNNNNEIKELKDENQFLKENIEYEDEDEDSSNNQTLETLKRFRKKIEKKKGHSKTNKSSFFDRLTEINSEKIRHHDRLLKEQLEKLLRDYEFRLSHEHRLRIPNEEYEAMLKEWMKSSQIFKAEFLSQSPDLKRPLYNNKLKKHGEESPWGGKFHITTKKQKNDKMIDILNLFDVVRKIKLLERPNATKNNNKKNYKENNEIIINSIASDTPNTNNTHIINTTDINSNNNNSINTTDNIQ